MRGKTFRARFRVKSATGWSGYSPVVEALASQGPVAPESAPVFVTATSTTLSITMTLSTDNGGTPITSHELWIDDGALGAF